MTAKEPNSRRNLDIAIERYAEGRGDAVQMRRTFASAVVGQMLPSGVVKGGSSLKLRFGEGGARASRDLDTARAEDLESFIENFERNLEIGWNGFTGTIAPGRPAKPKGVPDEYVMKPYSVRLSYNGKSWLTVPLEVGHNEIGDADEADYKMAGDIANMFAALGFPEPSPVALMKSHHQIAQKIHAVTTPGGSRAHDLVDLQIICSNCELDLPLVRKTCERLFAYRKRQEWPPRVTPGEGWQELYDEQRVGLDVLASVEDAAEWANELIEKIAQA